MASGIVGTLRARMGLDAGPFQRGLKQQRGAASAFAGQIRRIMAPVAAAMAGAFSVAAIKNSMGAIDAQAKLAKSLVTTSQSLQVLQRAGDLAGVSLQGIEQGTKDLFRRLSQAASGGGPAADALKRLGLSATELLNIPLDQRLAKINGAITEFIPQAERAAVASALFGREGSIALSRLDPTVIAQATEELRQFGFAISETDAAKIEQANDSLSKLGLIAQGLISQITVALAPALGAMADSFANAMREGAPLRTFIETLGANIGRIVVYASTFAAFMAGQWVVAMGAAILATASLSGAFRVLRAAIMRTGIGVLVVAAGELALQLTRLVGGAGGVGNALKLLADVARAAFSEIYTLGQGLMHSLKGLAREIAVGFLEAFATIAEKFGQMISDFLFYSPHLEAIGINLSEMIGPIGGQGAAAGLRETAAALSDTAANYYAAAAASFGAATETQNALKALRAAMVDAGEDGADAIDSLREALKKLDEAAAESAGGGAAGKVASLKDNMKDVADTAKRTAEQIKGVFVEGFKSALTQAKSFGDAMRGILSKLGDMLLTAGLNSLFGNLGAALKIPGFASGTSFAPGGLSRVNELGGELINLPRGSQVIPHDISKRMADRSGGGGNISIQIAVDGARGNSEIRAMVEQGVAEGLSQYDRQLPNRIRQYENDPRVRY